MPHSFGVRARTRDLFSQPFRRSGTIPATTLLATFRRGDYVDIKANPSVLKGLPHKFYHGKTGRVFNVTPHGIGVVVNKQVRNRIVQKKILVRAEHLKKS
jgi:large subunit ribosomal protein L21e|mmetsp:Transcript_10504/g.1579  ORF Transcript_10504/g.1579 Transcript_10504/m.1579 type:complete len:100 (-) Transcript_10504:207-506(-)